MNPVFEWLYSRYPFSWRFPERRGLVIMGRDITWKSKGIVPDQMYTIGAKHK